MNFPVFTDLRQSLVFWAAQLANNQKYVAEALEIKSWTPAVDTLAPMSISAQVPRTATYLKIGPLCFFTGGVDFTTAGAGYPTLFLGLPPPKPLTRAIGEMTFGAAATDAAPIAVRCTLDVVGNDSKIFIARYDNANWGIGAGRQVRVSGFYFTDS